MKKKIFRSFDKVLTAAIKKAPELETWPMYYNYRHSEITYAINLAGFKGLKKILDLGCGNSFSSALLSVIGDVVVATDIPEVNPRTHSVGLSNARLLRNRIGSTAQLVGSVGESLPFKENEFDLVFSMNVLEHVSDKRRVAEEIFRVLRRDGVLLLIVPYCTERIYATPHYYLHALKWLAKRLTAKSVKTTATEHIAKYGKFLTPPPHGNYARSFEEFLAHREKVWLSLVNPYFKVVKVFGSMIYPFDFCNELLGFKFGFALYKNLSRMFIRAERLFGKKALMPFSNSICIIAKRRGKVSLKNLAEIHSNFMSR